ncbi:squalene/phytoene synthase family protein [Pigmentibacter sp. JX0631]|uniref:squalene/phytoene synthase family protein n=1 Tax=Pigmentibacter sp. JX0631 TaxID=2976982 RepID=UPI002469BF58|nr:squalene/phytoene synthase family protein [Pigmentibacter sp. JX0631]WGL58893.1 squalene/phytoene synthase family protein [Pigmentibacter sp. JX0631]
MDLSTTQKLDIEYQSALNYCFTILPNVSRSFAIGIEFLTGELQNSVLIGYLLCRIIDTIEDDKDLDIALKHKFLQEFPKCFENDSILIEYQYLAKKLTGDKQHTNLLENIDKVFCVFKNLTEDSKIVLKKCVIEMAYGMADFVSRYPNGIRISSVEEYKKYCYYVAGTVGVLLTDLWSIHGRCISKQNLQLLNKNSILFGEALQTVNILKDIVWDAKNENSIYIPESLLRKHGLDHSNFLLPEKEQQSFSAINEMLILANDDVNYSLDYVRKLPLANFRIRFFCIFPLLLAIATLREIRKSENIIFSGKNIKVSRKQVIFIKYYSILASLFNFLLAENVVNKIYFLK